MVEERDSFRAPGRADRNEISLPEFFRRFPDASASSLMGFVADSATTGTSCDPNSYVG